MKGVRNLEFDTTGVGYFEVGKEAPKLEEMNEFLVKSRLKQVQVTSLTEVELPKPEAVYELQISGLG